MKIHISLVVYALPVSSLIKALSGPGVTFHLYRHSNNPLVIGDIDMNVLGLYDVHYHPYGVNRGLATSWNDGLVESQQMGADVMMIANDDIIADRSDMMLIANTAISHPEAGVIEAIGYDGNMKVRQFMNFALCAINPIAIEKVGYFDESYWPIYGEDCDFSRRCGLAGIAYYNAGETDITHLGSTTIKSVPELFAQNQLTFPKNEAYHARKWNGGYGHETFTVPFNDSRFDLRISAEDRHCPYPGYERTDL